MSLPCVRKIGMGHDLMVLRCIRCCLQDAAETREAFSALKSQFIAHHDMLDAKERELVRRDLKV